MVISVRVQAQSLRVLFAAVLLFCVHSERLGMNLTRVEQNSNRYIRMIWESL